MPRLIVCLAEETPPELFTQDLSVWLPVCRVARSLLEGPAPLEVDEPTEAEEPVHLFWYPAPPEADTPAWALTQQLIRHGLLLEPFARASAGLDELFGEADPIQP